MDGATPFASGDVDPMKATTEVTPSAAAMRRPGGWPAAKVVPRPPTAPILRRVPVRRTSRIRRTRRSGRTGAVIAVILLAAGVVAAACIAAS